MQMVGIHQRQRLIKEQSGGGLGIGPLIARQIAARNARTDEEREFILSDEYYNSDFLPDSPSTLPEGASRYEVIGRLGALVEADALSETQFNEEKRRLLKFEDGLVDDSDLTEFEKVVELWQSGHLTSGEFEDEKSRLVSDEPDSEVIAKKAGRSTAGNSKPVRKVSRPKPRPRQPRADLWDDSGRLTRSPGESSEVLERHGDPLPEARAEAREIFFSLKRWMQLVRRDRRTRTAAALYGLVTLGFIYVFAFAMLQQPELFAWLLLILAFPAFLAHSLIQWYVSAGSDNEGVERRASQNEASKQSLWKRQRRS